MASIQRVRRAWGDGWRVCYRTVDPDGKVVNVSTEAFRQERTAKRKKAEIELNIEGRVRFPKRQQLTLRQAFEESIGLEEGQGRGRISRGRLIGENKLSDYRSVARLHIIPKLGGRKLDDLTPALMRVFFDRLDLDGVGNARQQTVKTLLSSLLNEHVKLGSIPSRRWNGASPLSAPKPRAFGFGPRRRHASAAPLGPRLPGGALLAN